MADFVVVVWWSGVANLIFFSIPLSAEFSLSLSHFELKNTFSREKEEWGVEVWTNHEKWGVVFIGKDGFSLSLSQILNSIFERFGGKLNP